MNVHRSFAGTAKRSSCYNFAPGRPANCVRRTVRWIAGLFQLQKVLALFATHFTGSWFRDSEDARQEHLRDW